MLGKKTLINYHSGEARNHLSGSRFARTVLKRVGRVVSPSGYLVEVFGEFNLAAESVPNAVDVSQFKYRERTPVRPHLVCTRGFHPYYSIDVVIKAFAQIKKEYPGAQLDLIGGGALEDEMRQLVSDLKLTGVNFCGVASRTEIGRYYDQADIFINASRVDNMPVSILEAFASGTPVISTAPEGMRYLVENARTGDHPSMGLAVSLIIAAVGLILALAVHSTSSSIDVNTVGWILFLVGLVGFILDLLLWSNWGPGYMRRRTAYAAAQIRRTTRCGCSSSSIST